MPPPRRLVPPSTYAMIMRSQICCGRSMLQSEPRVIQRDLPDGDPSVAHDVSIESLIKPACL
jgi:hypothetical protein